MLRALFAFVAESRKEPAKQFVSIAPAPGRTGPVCEQVFDDMPRGFRRAPSRSKFNWNQATADSSRSSEQINRGDIAMRDIIFVAATFAFFLISIAYVKFCDRIR